MDTYGSLTYDEGSYGRAAGYVPPAPGVCGPVDGFDGTSLDTTKWPSSGGGTISVSNSSVKITPSADYPAIITQLVHNLADARVFMEVVGIPTAGTSGKSMEAQFTYGNLNGNRYDINLNQSDAGAILNFGQMLDGKRIGNQAAITYNATNHKWWAMRESNGTIYFETSPDGNQWTVQSSEPALAPVTNGLVAIAAGFYGGTFSSPGLFTIGGVNTGNDTTPPLVDVTTAGGKKISSKSGKDSYPYAFTVNEACSAYQVRLVPSFASTVTAGTLIESGGAIASGQSVIGSITYAEMSASGGAEGNNVVKFFARDTAGNWSTT